MEKEENKKKISYTKIATKQKKNNELQKKKKTMTGWKRKKSKKKMMMIKMLELRLMLMSTVIKKQSAGLPLHWVPRQDRTTECLYSTCCIGNGF